MRFFAEHHHVRIHAGHYEALRFMRSLSAVLEVILRTASLKGEQALFPHVTGDEPGKAA